MNRAAHQSIPTQSGLRVNIERGHLEVTPAVVAIIAGHAASSCYGVMGMAASGLRDGFAQLLRRENLYRGVEVSLIESGLAIDLYVVLQYGVRIVEVVRNLQETVCFEVERAVGTSVAEVNVTVQGVYEDRSTI
ncbi:MAG: Asp23/Gls24 family envelope stress response protein [Candidatus Dormibacteraceae bacterium]